MFVCAKGWMMLNADRSKKYKLLVDNVFMVSRTKASCCCCWKGVNTTGAVVGLAAVLVVVVLLLFKTLFRRLFVLFGEEPALPLPTLKLLLLRSWFVVGDGLEVLLSRLWSSVEDERFLPEPVSLAAVLLS